MTEPSLGALTTLCNAARTAGCADGSQGQTIRRKGVIAGQFADMSEPKDRKPLGAELPEDQRRSGRVGFDERGNSVWEWQLETGVYSRDISTHKLKKLDLDDLSIAETATHRRPPGLDPKEKPPLPRGGFNPYDSSPAREAGGNPYDTARGSGVKMQPSAGVAPPARKPMDLQRLEEWMKIKKRLQDAQDAGENDD
jgi:hypothetical protein